MIIRVSIMMRDGGNGRGDGDVESIGKG